MYLSVVHIYRHTVAALDVYKINDAAAVRWIDRSFSLSTCAGSSSPAQPTKIKKEDIIYEIERERREADADGMNPILHRIFFYTVIQAHWMRHTPIPHSSEYITKKYKYLKFE
jgi:hypothetical protein